MIYTQRIVNRVKSQLILSLMPVLLLLVSVGCAGGPESQPASSAPANEPAPASQTAAGPRVFFVQPQNGAMVKSPVHFEFGIADYTLSPVPKPAPDKPREGMGHHHLGVDTDCLPVGEVIPMAQPWIHFGGGQTTIDMQLAPGPHRFALQLGDDQHRTLSGLCETISITVGQ